LFSTPSCFPHVVRALSMCGSDERPTRPSPAVATDGPQRTAKVLRRPSDNRCGGVCEKPRSSSPDVFVVPCAPEARQDHMALSKPVARRTAPDLIGLATGEPGQTRRYRWAVDRGMSGLQAGMNLPRSGTPVPREPARPCVISSRGGSRGDRPIRTGLVRDVLGHGGRPWRGAADVPRTASSFGRGVGHPTPRPGSAGAPRPDLRGRVRWPGSSRVPNRRPSHGTRAGSVRPGCQGGHVGFAELDGHRADRLE
jgi:hypothetical protein